MGPASAAPGLAPVQAPQGRAGIGVQKIFFLCPKNLFLYVFLCLGVLWCFGFLVFWFFGASCFLFFCFFRLGCSRRWLVRGDRFSIGFSIVLKAEMGDSRVGLILT